MRKRKMILPGLLAGVMAGMLLTGCTLGKKDNKLETGEISNDSVVMLVGGESVRLTEIKTYCYFLKCQYEDSFGEELWEYPVSSTETIGDKAKQEIVNMITQLKVIHATALEQGVSLTAEEQDQALQQAEELVGNATKKDKKKYSLTVQEVSEIYQENALANKMFYIATDDASTNVSDEEARQVSLQYLEIITNGTDSSGNNIQMNAQEKVEALERARNLREEVPDGQDFLAYAQLNTDAAQAEITIGRETDQLEHKAVVAAFSLRTGEISDVIQGDQGYYILYCVSEQNEEAADQRKEEIIEQRQNEMFMKKYNEWMKGKDVDINQSFWNDFSI